MDISDISKQQQELMGVVDKLDDRMLDAEKMIQKLYTAFPAGDVEGHRRYHDREIRRFDQRERLIAAIQEKTISGFIWSGIVGLGFILWKSFLHFIGK